MLGVSVTTREAPPSRGAPTNTGTWFAIGFADQGPSDSPTLVQSLADYNRVYGARSATNLTLNDAIDAYFREGGSRAYVGRVVGPGATSASLVLEDTEDVPAETLQVQAKNPGAYGDSLSVSVTVDGANFSLVVSDASGTLETSPSFASKAEAVAWQSQYVTVTDTAPTNANNPAALNPTPLAGGDDDRDGATAASYEGALGLFGADLGPGQVSAPGLADSASYELLFAHAAANNRFAVCDAPDTSVFADLEAPVAGLGGVDKTYGAVFGPRVLVPGPAGVVGTTTREVPASAVVAGLCARVDADGNPNRAAAGGDYPLQYALDFKYAFNDADREALLNAGVNTFKVVYGVLENYGFQTPAVNDPVYWQANCARMRMALVAEAKAIGENYMFKPIDGRGLLASAFASDLAAMLSNYYGLNALYGETKDDAYVVDVGASVNTDSSIAQGELIAVVSVRLSLHAKAVEIQLVSVPVTQAV